MIKYFVAIVALFFAFNSGATEVYVIATQGKGVAESDLEVVTELIETSVVNLEGFTISDNRWKSDLALRPKLLKLGSSYIFSITSYKGKKVHKSRKMKASSIEEMDKVVQRVVRATLKGKSVQAAAQVDDVTREEVAQSRQRYQAIKQWSFGLGAGWGNNIEYSKTGTSILLGYNFGVDPQFDLGLVGEILFATGSEDVSFNDISIDVSYFFNKSKIAPFALVGFGYGYASAEEEDSNTLIGSNDNASGFVLKVGGGLKFFRTSTVQMGVQGTYSHMFSKTKYSKEEPGLTSLMLVISY